MRRTRTIFTTAIALFALAMAAVAQVGLRAVPVASDLAVVLGNDVRGGVPAERLQARLDKALSLYANHYVSRIMVSGGVEADGSDEAAIMAAYLIRHGIPPDAIIVDSRGKNTMATAVDAARYMKRNNLRSVIAVSQYFHIARCYLAFRRAGIPLVFGAAPRYYEWRDIWSLAREVVALPWYAVHSAGSK